MVERNNGRAIRPIPNLRGAVGGSSHDASAIGAVMGPKNRSLVLKNGDCVTGRRVPDLSGRVPAGAEHAGPVGAETRCHHPVLVPHWRGHWQRPVAVDKGRDQPAGGDMIGEIVPQNRSELRHACGRVVAEERVFGSLQFQQADRIGQAAIRAPQLAICQLGFGSFHMFGAPRGSHAPGGNR